MTDWRESFTPYRKKSNTMAISVSQAKRVPTDPPHGRKSPSKMLKTIPPVKISGRNLRAWLVSILFSRRKFVGNAAGSGVEHEIGLEFFATLSAHKILNERTLALGEEMNDQLRCEFNFTHHAWNNERFATLGIGEPLHVPAIVCREKPVFPLAFYMD